MDIQKYLKLELSNKKFTNESKSSIIRLLENANRELERYYTGEYRFVSSLNESIIKPDDLKISPKKKRRIKEIWLKFDSELSQVQRKFENFLQNEKEENG